MSVGAEITHGHTLPGNVYLSINTITGSTCGMSRRRWMQLEPSACKDLT